MKDALEKLKEFHRVFNCARSEELCSPDVEIVALRISLMKEELEETIMAMKSLSLTGQPADMAEVADGLADLCYVAIGTAVAYGIPLDQVFEEVHRSNMAKAIKCPDCFDAVHARIECQTCKDTGYVVTYRSDGKVLKPEGWTPPDIKGVLGL
jgi:predicted HAD superfamily Cof-like phosphohydrolase